MSKVLIEINNLKKYFYTNKGPLHAVDNLNFDIYKGETLGVVGESGCGKSTAGRAILRLHEPTSGEVLYDGKNILNYNRKEMNEMRKKMQIVFQDPYSSLNPRLSVFDLIADPLYVNKDVVPKDKIGERVQEVMELVGLEENTANSFPHELDGGRRQRVGIARSLILRPEFIVLDEPVSALDVSIQAQILNLLDELQEDLGLTYMFIAHDLSVVKHISDRIAVMYLGKFVELTDYNTIFKNPLHPYTQALLSAIPIPKVGLERERIVLKGDVPSPINPEPGCGFYGRCRYRKDVCKEKAPELLEKEPGHFVACHLI